MMKRDDDKNMGDWERKFALWNKYMKGCDIYNEWDILDEEDKTTVAGDFWYKVTRCGIIDGGLISFDALKTIICPLACSLPVHPDSALNDLNELSEPTHTLTVLIFDVLFSSLRISSIIVLDSPSALTDIASIAAASESEKIVNKDKTSKTEAKIPNFEIMYI